MHATQSTIAEMPQPMQLSGCLEHFESFQSTPCIGTEFPRASLTEWLRAPNADELLRDLAVTIAQRGVVFFRAQTGLTPQLHKELITRLGQLSGRPAENGLYATALSKLEQDPDPECHYLDTSRLRAMYAKGDAGDKRQSGRIAWHSDTTFEPNPPDFSSLRLTEVPKTGGDTLWASGYELYDRLSTGYQRFVETLTATHSNPGMNERAKAMGGAVWEGPRGAPDNSGNHFTAVHPVVRTHPTTGWKSVYCGGTQCRRINELTSQESEEVITKLMRMIMENHDLQVRFRWHYPGDIAIWDNRSAYHAPTGDQQGARTGWRTVGVGEKPYLDPGSTGRAEALAKLAANAPPAKTEKSPETRMNGHGIASGVAVSSGD